MGYVQKENFDDDPDSLYPKRDYAIQLVENKAKIEKEAVETRQMEASAKAYDEWLAQKELREQAVRFLAYLPSPKSGINVSSSTASVAFLPNLASLDRDPDSALNTLINVGKALKKVDRTLVQEWLTWCNNFFPTPYLQGTYASHT
jgi:hypothetical protein